MANTLDAKFTLDGAPPKSDYVATRIDVGPNAPPLPAKVIRSNDDENRSLTFEFINGFGDGDHELNKINTSVVYVDKSHYLLEGLSGSIKISLLDGTYEGNFTADWKDSFQRIWKVEGTINVKVVPQKKA
ncbi:hypothetical protein [Pseudomonas mandelii]|uniref:hypothetical protein n=1 Tax=Pseudomonas mandelii TaxID=75612 RepID=UPI00209F000A|nr:hypothetical protein [Pseudomonas mandelii]MCO8312251.1 hypothetical protein [Pseudomonas mandelii]